MGFSKTTKIRMIGIMLFLSISFMLAGCDDSGDGFVWPSYDRMHPEEYARDILCGDWEAFAVCISNHDDAYSRDCTFSYYYDGSRSVLEELPDLSDLAYNGITSTLEDSELCKEFNVSIYSDQKISIRYGGGKILTLTYQIDQVQEDYICCTLYSGDTLLMHSGTMHIYQNNEGSVKEKYTLKIVCGTYPRFTSMSVKSGI